jgi:HlyD family secretion protein
MPKPKRDYSTLSMLILAAILALGVGYYVPQSFSSKAPPAGLAGAAIGQPPAPAKSAWVASAPGRVEPAGGEIRIGAQVPGRIAEVLVSVNDQVFPGDLLVRLEDDELLARVHSAEAEVAVRRRDRDNESVGRLAQDRRNAEDAVANAERQLANARAEYDRLFRAQRAGTTKQGEVTGAREAVVKAKERLDQARANLRRLVSGTTLPAQTRLEAALATARAELSLAEAALERTRIRSPIEGTVLQLNARVGETTAPSPEGVLAIVGDISELRVRAEFDERDLGKINIGQAAVVRSDAFPGKEFEGKVASLARVLGPSKIGQRGPRKPTDVDVLEVLIDLPGELPLLPGMRVDVFLKPSATAEQRPEKSK